MPVFICYWLSLVLYKKNIYIFIFWVLFHWLYPGTGSCRGRNRILSYPAVPDDLLFQLSPLLITSIWWEFCMVESRWAIINDVLPSCNLRRPSWISFSVLVSTLLVASSRISMRGSATIARAMVSICLWPWLKSAPPPRNMVSYPWGCLIMKSWALACFAAWMSGLVSPNFYPFTIISLPI